MRKDIYLAAGCFWGAERFFKLIHGVVATEVGYANGNIFHPTYREVYTDYTGYAEAVHVTYETDVIGLERILQFYFRAIDPTSVNKQGNDEGTRYRTGIYYSDPEDLASIQKIYDRMAGEIKAPRRRASELFGQTSRRLLPYSGIHNGIRQVRIRRDHRLICP